MSGLQYSGESTNHNQNIEVSAKFSPALATGDRMLNFLLADIILDLRKNILSIIK